METVVSLRALNLVLGCNPKSTIEYYQAGVTMVRYDWACGCHALCDGTDKARAVWCTAHADVPMPSLILSDDSVLKKSGRRPMGVTGLNLLASAEKGED